MGKNGCQDSRASNARAMLQILHGVTIDKNIKGKIALLELLAVGLDSRAV